MMVRTLFTVAALAAAVTVSAGKYYTKEVKFPAAADSVTKIDMASRVVPTASQLAWQELELTAFLHFGVNTFTDREWGDGKETPAVFAPASLDAGQWVRTLRDAGFRMVILTAKHHDGFCLWPTATTAHSVKNSPWMNGNGDVVALLREACDKYGMKLGLYLSPWDRNAECYGDTPRYNDMFVGQLTELLSNYGKIDEVWFDGACGEGPNGKKQIYDWGRFKNVIKKLQPEAVVAIMGDDVRWVGNENGTGRLTEWSVTPKMPGILDNADEHNSLLGLDDMASDLGSRRLVAHSPGVRWWPSEVDVSIRPGWFYHERENPKSLRELADIYLNSVGRNSVLLLNVPPDKAGRIHPSDSVRLLEMGRWIRENFSHNLIEKTDVRNSVCMLSPDTEVNCVVLGEDLTKGQRVERVEVSAREGNEWKRVARATTVGYKRILMFPAVKTSGLRVEVIESRGEPHLKTVEAYKVEMPPEYRSAHDNELYPGENLKVISINGTAVPVESMAAAFDGDAASVWVSPVKSERQEFVVDMGRDIMVDGFIYTPRTDGVTDGTVFKYEFALSADGKNWAAGWKGGEFSNVVNNPIPQKVYMPAPVKARYFRFTTKGEVDCRPTVAIAEFSIMVSNETD